MNHQSAGASMHRAPLDLRDPHLPAAVANALDIALAMPAITQMALSRDARHVAWIESRALAGDARSFATTAVVADIATTRIHSRHPGVRQLRWLGDGRLVALPSDPAGGIRTLFPQAQDWQASADAPTWSGFAGVYGDGVLMWATQPWQPGEWIHAGREIESRQELWWVHGEGGTPLPLSAPLPLDRTRSAVHPAPDGSRLLLSGTWAGDRDRPCTWMLQRSSRTLPGGRRIEASDWRALELLPRAEVLGWSPDGRQLLLHHEPSSVRMQLAPRQLWAWTVDAPLSTAQVLADIGETMLDVTWTVQGIVARVPRGTHIEVGTVRGDTFSAFDTGGRPAIALEVVRGACAVLALEATGLPTVLAGPVGALQPVGGPSFVCDDTVFGSCERISWRAPDGVRIDGVLHRPLGAQIQPLALLVVLKGGPPSIALSVACDGDRRWAYPVPALLAAGIAVLSVNYGGSIGHGRDFQDQVTCDPPGCVGLGDVEAGVQHLVREGVVDARRVGLAGWSYGGTLAAVACADSRCFRAMSIGAGGSDLDLMLLTAPYPIWCAAMLFPAPLPDQNRIDAASPVRRISRASPPTLIQHGDRDPWTSLMGAALHRALVQHGVETIFQRFPAGGHGVFAESPAGARATATANVAWFLRHLG